MGSSALLGFRPPQFSEDAAWLPIWLQPQNFQALDEGINGGETPFLEDERVKELPSWDQEIKDETGNLSTSDRGGYKSCRLLLSEDESSPLCFASSNDNVSKFHLQLSSDTNSEWLENPLEDSSQVQRLFSNRAMSKKPVGPSVVSEEKIHHSDMGCNSLVINRAPNPGCLKENHNLRHEGNDGFCQVDDIDEAVELSIAASEALVIHEVMTGVVTKSFLATKVLEAAMKVKQARLDIWKESLQCLSLHIGETASRSDMDDLIVEDGHDNIGLSIVDSLRHEYDVSQVKDTFDSENHRCEGNTEHEETGGFLKLLDDCEVQTADEGLYDKMKVEETCAPEVSCCNRWEGLPNMSALCLDSVGKDCSTSLAAHCSEQESFQVSAPMEVAEFGDLKDGSSQAHAESYAKTSEASESYNAINFIPSKFQSRWFGGWTCKEDEKSLVQMEHREAQGIPKPFVNEMSYLSESADVAPDENSVVQIRSKRNTPASQSSIPSEVCCNKAHEAISSQDVVRFSSLSAGDPFCSVVGCSLSSENICSPTLSKHEHDISRNCTISKSEYTADNLQRTSTVVELVPAQEHIVPVIYPEFSVVRRMLTSLRPYSVSLVKESSCHGTLPAETNPKSSAVGNSWSNLSGIKSCNKVLENDAFTTYLQNKEKISTHVHDHAEEKSEIHGAPEVFWNNKEPLKAQSFCENYNSFQIPARKRVRFVEADNINFAKRKLPKYQATLKNCHMTKACKRSRTTNRRCNSGGQELKRCVSENWQRLLFQNMEFLLTGFSIQKEKQYEDLIKEYGGVILSDIPSPNSRGNKCSRFSSHMLPIVLSSKKLETIKFLYGCAVNTLVLKADWLTDSIVAGSILPPQRYSILHKRLGGCSIRSRKPLGYIFRRHIFDDFGVMLHGKNNFCMEMSKIVKHGGGKVFKALKCLLDNINTERISLGAIVAENESTTSRHLKQCALEYKIPVMSSQWIIKSLHVGKLLPFSEKKDTSLITLKLPNCSASMELSEEI